MRVTDFESCFKLMTKIDAEAHLMSMSIAQYPHSKDKFRRDLHKEITALANPKDPDAEPMAMADLAKMLAMGGTRG